jgi:hypothetical protein
MHPRNAIRDEVHTRLAANSVLSAAGWTFEKGRARPVNLDPGDKRAWVYTDRDVVTDTPELGTVSTQRQMLRDVQLIVVLNTMATRGETADDVADDAAEEIEKEILADTTQNGLAVETEYSATDAIRSAEGLAVLGTAVLVFTVTYQHNVPVDGGA